MDIFAQFLMEACPTAINKQKLYLCYSFIPFAPIKG